MDLVKRLKEISPLPWRRMKRAGPLPAGFDADPVTVATCKGTFVAEYKGPRFAVAVKGPRGWQSATDRRLRVALDRAERGAKAQEPRPLRVPRAGETGSRFQTAIIAALTAKGAQTARELADTLEVPESMKVAGIYRTLSIMVRRGQLRVCGQRGRQGTPMKLYEPC